MPFGTEFFYQIPGKPVQAITVKQEMAVGDRVTIVGNNYQIVSFKRMIVEDCASTQNVAILREAIAKIRYA